MEVERTILIADDERSVRSAFKAIFEAEGYNVVLARDGVEAIQNFEEKRIDLILMDVMMPRKNGLVACAEIRKKDPLIPILFFTAMPTDVSMVSAFGFGADDYIEPALQGVHRAYEEVPRRQVGLPHRVRLPHL